MPYSPDQLIKITSNYAKLTEQALVKFANKCNCENLACSHGNKTCHNKAGDKKALYVGRICDECAKHMPEKYMKKDAAEKKKMDMKAKVRNRGTVCVPAEHAKDKKDHFPINDEDQARNALARVHQYSSAPSWYNGSLTGLQALVSRKVHSKYPGIGKSEKKSSLEDFEKEFTKYASPQDFYEAPNF